MSQDHCTAELQYCAVHVTRLLYCWITVLYRTCHMATVLLNYSTVQYMSQGYCTAELQYCTAHVTWPLYCWITVLYSTCHKATVLLNYSTIQYMSPFHCTAVFDYSRPATVLPCYCTVGVTMPVYCCSIVQYNTCCKVLQYQILDLGSAVAKWLVVRCSKESTMSSPTWNWQEWQLWPYWPLWPSYIRIQNSLAF